MTFTVITVCYNAERFLKDTIESVLSQTYEDYEYIIKDGGSSDLSLDIINTYKNGSNIVVISQSDNGIYDAMNRAVEQAKGDYIIFLNSGDTFFDKDVLADIAVEIKKGSYDIIYGNITVINRAAGEVKQRIDYATGKRLNMTRIVMGYTVCHQAIFSRRSLFKEKLFDEGYKYWADQEWLFYQLKRRVKVHAAARMIAYYDSEGVSSNADNIDAIHSENDKMVRKYAPVAGAVIVPLKMAIRCMRKYLRRNDAGDKF